MPTSIRLPPALEKRLDALVARTGRTKAFYLREMIAEGIEEAEDYYLAARVMRRVRAGKERLHTTAEVRERLGLDD